MIHRAYRLFGNMTTVSIKTRYADAEVGTSSGFGFMHFETVEGARSAVNFGHSLNIDGVHYAAEFSKHMVRRGEALSPPPPRGTPCRQLHVSPQPLRAASFPAYAVTGGDANASSAYGTAPNPGGFAPYGMYAAPYQQQHGMGYMGVQMAASYAHPLMPQMMMVRHSADTYRALSYSNIM
jgi:hypothetical protein